MKFSKHYTVVFITLMIFNVSAKDEVEAMERSLLSESRQQFSISVDQEDRVVPAIELFKQLRIEFPELSGRAEVYLGALEAIKGKHAFWPHQKITHVNAALKMMDKGLAQNPDDLEALFVHANIYYNLPFFFATKDEGARNYGRIVELMPREYQNFDKKFILDVIDYYQNELKRPQDEMTVLAEIKNKILNDGAKI